MLLSMLKENVTEHVTLSRNLKHSTETLTRKVPSRFKVLLRAQWSYSGVSQREYQEMSWNRT